MSNFYKKIITNLIGSVGRLKYLLNQAGLFASHTSHPKACLSTTFRQGSHSRKPAWRNAFLIMLLLHLLISSNAYAQFPVSVNTQLTSPNLPYLADYVRQKPESLRAIFLLTDDSRSNYDVLLKVRISGQGIELASRPDYFSTPINLLYNVPEILTGFELADLFDPNNLEISGMSKTEFLKTGQLPEGIYTICFEAYDVNRFNELPVSNGGCAVASVIEHEPPYLSQPVDLINYTEPTVLPFNWHPGHTNSFRTEYRLYLYEEIPGWTYDQIILSQAPLYTAETMTTTYLYTANDPLLEKGASYLWRVQAYDPDGFELFKNNGFSQLAKFTYGQNCDAPLGIQSLTVSDRSQLISWVDSSPGTYELQYRMEIINLTIPTPPNTTPTTPSNGTNPTAGIGAINSKNGKSSPVGVNNTAIQGNPNSPARNPNHFNYSNSWKTVSDITEQEYIINDLSPYRYEIQVRRVCGPGNTSPWSVALELDNRQPESPEFLLPPEATEPTEVAERLFTANWDYQTEAYFELQIARDTGFAILLPGYENLMVTDLQQVVEGLSSGQTYYYRVKAKRGDLESDYSNVQTVSTISNSPYNFPTLLALPAQPTDYDGFTAQWTGTGMMMQYHLEVARDRAFTQPILGFEEGVYISMGMTELPVSVDLLAQGVFYRIRTTFWGVGYSNIIEVPRQYLPIPIALEPTEITNQGFTANWEALPEASEYIIDVSTSPDFSEVIPELSNQTVNGTSINFNQYLDPENTTYFYQVRAKIEGRTSGNSNPIVVSDGRLAVVPITEPATQIKKTSFWANWQNLPGINTYALDVATSPDFSEGSFVAGYENKIVYGESHKVDPVNFASTQYFYRVRAVVDEVYSIYSNDQNVNWKGCYFGPMAMDYSCGIPADPYFNEGLPLIAELEKGDTVQAGDFLVILNEVTESSPFSGTGYVAMPFQQLRINLAFSNIKVDETCRMVDGRMEVTGAGLALISEEIADKINDIVDVLDVIDQSLEVLEKVLEELSEVLSATEAVGGYFTNGINLLKGTDPIFAEYPYLPPNATDSLQLALDCFKNTFSPDCKDDLVSGLQALQNNLADHFNSSQQIIFHASPDQVYGFDSIVHPAFTSHYQGIIVSGKPYQIPWKSVENGQTDVVEARTANGLPFPENIRFEDTDQNEIPTEIDGNIARLTITGVGDQVAYPIYAVETGDTVKLAGKLNIVSYDPKPINLVVVPVNGALYPYPENSLRTKLKAIFKPAIDSLSVTLADNFDTNEFDEELDEISTNLAQSYTREMKNLFQDFKDKNEILDDTYYIFLLPRFAETDQLGYMPRKRKFGFVNHEQLNAKEDEYVKTIAHELSHGAFVLHHTFVQHEQLVDNPTQNLLDNSKTGTILHKYQWDAVHNPSKAWVLFDEDEERANLAAGNLHYKCVKPSVAVSLIQEGYQFVDIEGNPISLSEIPIAFAGSDETPERQGTLVAIAKDNNYYGPSITFGKTIEYHKKFISFTNPSLFIEKPGTSSINPVKVKINNGKAIVQTLEGNTLREYENATRVCPFDNYGSNNQGVPSGKTIEEIFLILSQNVTPDDQEAIDGIWDLATHIKSISEGYKTVFYYEYVKTDGTYDFINQYTDGTGTDFYEALSRNSILTVETFNNLFQIFTYEYEDPYYIRDLDRLVSNIDLWRGENDGEEIAEGYNAKVVDYSSYPIPSITEIDETDPNAADEILAVLDWLEELKDWQLSLYPDILTTEQKTNLASYLSIYREDPLSMIVHKNHEGYRYNHRMYLIGAMKKLGVFEPYVYDINELILRRQILKGGNNAFFGTIYNAEQAGQAIPLTISNDFQQYTSFYDTESAFYLGLDYLKLYVEELLEPDVVLKALSLANKVFGKSFKQFRALEGKNINEIIGGVAIRKLDELISQYPNFNKFKSLDDVAQARISKDLEKIGQTDGRLASLNDDLGVENVGDDLVRFFDEEVGGIKAWKILSDAGEVNLVNRIYDLDLVNDYLKKNPSKTSDDLTGEISDSGGYSNWKISRINVLKNQFLEEIGQELPQNWNKFSPIDNIEFAKKLKLFRSNNDLSFNPELRGGEGQLFDTSNADDLVLKRWFWKRKKDMNKSIELLIDAKNLVQNNTELKKVINVISTGERGTDWVIRGFDERSIPLIEAITDPIASKARQDAIDLLTNPQGTIATNILKKLNKNSENLHWLSFGEEKIIIIDMQ